MLFSSQHIMLAKEFAGMVQLDDRFQVTHEVVLGLVCFRLKVNIITLGSIFCAEILTLNECKQRSENM